MSYLLRKLLGVVPSAPENEAGAGGGSPPADAGSDAGGAADTSSSAPSSDSGESARADGAAGSETPAEPPKYKSSLDAVRARMSEMRKEGEKAAGIDAKGEQDRPEGEQGANSHDDDDALLPDSTPEERANLDKKTEQRIRTLLGERKELRTKLADAERVVQERIAPIEGAANSYKQMQDWVQTSGLKPNDVTQALSLAAMIVHDPMAALEQLEPIYQGLRRQAGAALPNDLADDVEAGRISEERAKELSRERARASHLASMSEAQRAAAERQHAEREQVEASSRLGAEMSSAVAALEKTWASNDPDYSRKAELIRRECLAIFQEEGPPRSGKAAAAVAQRAKDAVDKYLSSVVPRGSSGTRNIPQQKNNADLEAKPASPLDAMRQAAQRAGMKVVAG
jgi:hypothetical protein